MLLQLYWVSVYWCKVYLEHGLIPHACVWSSVNFELVVLSAKLLSNVLVCICLNELYIILDISLYNVRCQGRWYHRGTQELSCIVSFRINGLNWLCVSPWLYNSVIEFGICGLTLLSVSGLVGFHTCLIANMKTTNEDVSMVHASVETGSGQPGHILFRSSGSDPDWITWDVKLIETQYGIAMIDATATFILHEP